MQKNKIIFLPLLAILSFSLSNCKTVNNFEQQGFTQKVIYDLGEGIYTGSNRNTNTLTLYFKPGSPITDFTGVQGYEFTRKGDEDVTYEFGGWYHDQNFENPVDFENYTLPEESGEAITIYAKWIEIFDKHFNIYYQNETSNDFSLLTSLEWDMNKQFTFNSELIQYPSEDEYTYIAAYTDPEMTKLVDSSYVLTNDVDELPIYTKWIKGKYKIINNAKDYSNYFSKYVATYNMYLNADIDLSSTTIGSIALIKDVTILGNNHKISNLKYDTIRGEGGSKTTVTLGGLANKLENVVIKDLVIEDAVYTMNSVTCAYLNFAPIAGETINCSFENVTISGQIVYHNNALNRLENGSLKEVRAISNKVMYKDDETKPSTITNCVLNITDSMEEN